MDRVPNIVLEEVNSSQISKIGYYDNILLVEFKGGSRYIYIGVDNYTYNNLINAESKGSFFSKYIKSDSGIKCVRIP